MDQTKPVNTAKRPYNGGARKRIGVLIRNRTGYSARTWAVVDGERVRVTKSLGTDNRGTPRSKMFTARFELDENGYWSVLAEIATGRSAISDGQTLPKARRRIRQSIALLLDADENTFDVHEEISLPPKAMATLRRYQGAQEKLQADVAEAPKPHARRLRSWRSWASAGATRAICSG